MKVSSFILLLSVVATTIGQLSAQSTKAAADAAPAPLYQTLNFIKVTPGKNSEFVQFTNETSRKIAEMRLAAGEIVSWTLLRSVMPAGQEARADYMISTITNGVPLKPVGRADAEPLFKKAGLSMPVQDFFTTRDKLSSLVATEMWRPRIRVGAPEKGHYMYINYMKVTDVAGYNDFEEKVWQPMAQHWVKEGSMSGWLYATKQLPGGTDTTYSALSVDMFPTWDATFKVRTPQPVFEKVHPGKSYPESTAQMAKLRQLARRELWTVVERVAKK